MTARAGIRKAAFSIAEGGNCCQMPYTVNVISPSFEIWISLIKIP